MSPEIRKKIFSVFGEWEVIERGSRAFAEFSKLVHGSFLSFSRLISVGERNRK